MAEKAAYSLKSNATRLGQRLGENIAERTREIGLIDSFASGSGGSSGKYLENGVVVTQAGIEETKKMLASRRESDKLEGLKRVIAMMTKNLPVTVFFPLVVSLLSPTATFQSRTLISLYIIHCASTAPSLALLSINSYQKDLSDPNPLIRAGAIKTLSSMGLEDIRSLVGVAVEKGIRDTSWYVRRTTGDAILSLWRQDPTYDNKSRLLPSLIVLLNSASPLTIGSALSVWEEICGTRWDLIHSGFRKWCKMLVDVEEWGQCVLLRVLLRYGRTFFLDPQKNGSILDPDLELLLRGSEVLFQHLNPAVVSAVIKLHYYLAPVNRLQKIVKPLLRLLGSSPEVQMIALEDCAVVADERPTLLSDHIAEFYVRLSEPLVCKRLRLRILVALMSEKNVRILLPEFLVYVKDTDDVFSAEAINAIGVCSRKVPAIAQECVKTLLQLTRSSNDIIIAQSILVLRSLIQSPSLPSTISRASTIQNLVHLLHDEEIKSSSARANIYWLLGQYASLVIGGAQGAVESLADSLGPDVVRVGALHFVTEILTLSTKLLILSHTSTLTPHLRTLSLLFTYLTALARYDLTYEVRDRARFLKGLLSSAGVGTIKEGLGRESTLRLSDEDFAKGIQIKDLVEEKLGGKDQEEGRTMTAEQVRVVLFDGKDELCRDTSDTFSPQELGTLDLSLPRRQHLIFSRPLPTFSTTVPPSSIRDVLSFDSLNSKNSNNSNIHRSIPSSYIMRGFGSDSFNNDDNNNNSSNNSSGRNSNGRSTPVVLVPTNYANDSEERIGSFGGVSGSTGGGGGGGGRGNISGGFKDLNEFYADDSSENEEEEEEDEGGKEEGSEESDSVEEERESESSGSEEDEEEEDESSSDEEDNSSISRSIEVSKFVP